MKEGRFHLSYKVEPSDILREVKLKRDYLDFALQVFIWLGTMFAWFVFVAILQSVLGEGLPTFLVAFVFAFLIRYSINQLIYQREVRAAELMAAKSDQVNVTIGDSGIDIVVDRTTTRYGREDLRSIMDHGDVMEIEMVGGSSLFIPLRIFSSPTEYTNCISFLGEMVSAQDGPTFQ